MRAQKIEFSAKNVKPFTDWLKKFTKIDTALLLEVDEINSEFISKVYNEERSVVKLSRINFEDAGLKIKPSKDPKRVKVGIYNIVRLIKIMDQFNDDDFTFTVNYDEISGDTVEFAGLTLLLKNKKLKMTVECTSLNIFKYISDDLFKDVISALDSVVTTFELSATNIEKTNSLCALDNEHKFMEFKSGKGFHISGKTFDLLIGEDVNTDDENSISIFKEQFDSIDLENYTAKMGEDRIVFTSTSGSTVTVISMVETD